jgi:hypothetical protein
MITRPMAAPAQSLGANLSPTSAAGRPREVEEATL